MTRGRRLLLLLYCLATFSKLHAQPLLRHPAVVLQGFYGSFLTNLPKAQYLRDSYSYFGELSLQQQTDGRKNWQRANGLPEVGLALFYGNTGSKQYLGTMAGVFPFVTWKLYRQNAFTSKLRVGAGLGWVQKPYNKISNHKNVMIGTYGNAYINFLWQNEVRLLPTLYLNAGLSFSHFSNGSTTLPNLGLNIPALSVGLRYAVAANPPVSKQKQAPIQKKIAFTLWTTLGVKQFPWIESKRYVVNTLQGEWSRQFHYSGKYSGGAVLFYDRSLEVDPSGIPDHKRTGNNLQAGVFVGYEHLFGRLSVPIQLGAYVYNHDIYAALFQQLGFRYQVNTNWTAQFLMKTHSGKADFLHAGIGYRFN